MYCSLKGQEPSVHYYLILRKIIITKKEPVWQETVSEVFLISVDVQYEKSNGAEEVLNTFQFQRKKLCG